MSKEAFEYMKEYCEGSKIEMFEFEERVAYVIHPTVKPNGRLILKTEYLTAFPNCEKEMLGRGYYLCFITHRNRWATDEETDIMARFVRFVAKKYSLNEKCILVGMSCGGLQAVKFAECYPELSAVLYIDAPVLNILSMVGLGEGQFDANMWRELVSAYGFSKSTVINFRGSPIDNMQPLIDNNIPIIMLYGNADNVVIYEENGKVLEEFYRKNGGNLKVIEKTMQGHHPHGLEDPTPIIDFIEKNM